MRGSVEPGTSQEYVTPPPAIGLLISRNGRLENARHPKHLKGILYLPLLRPFPYRCVMAGWIPFEIGASSSAEVEAGHKKY